jgi:regulator of replication initiation timing
MTDLDKNDQKSISVMNKGFVQQAREYLLANPLDNLPSLFLLGVAAFGLLTLASFLLTDLLTFPFVLVAIFACLFSAWHIRILGSMKVQIERLTEQNDTLNLENEKFAASNLSFTQRIAQFTDENTRLSDNLTDMEATANDLKHNNDRLHQELTALGQLKNNLQQYADEAKLDFSQLLKDVNQRFQRLEVITVANERVLLQRIAQDLEFLDREAGMQRDEYERFIRRIPEHLLPSFKQLADTSFAQVAGDDQQVDHKEIQALVHQVLQQEELKYG